MLLPCVLYALTAGLHFASCVASLPSPSGKFRGSTPRPNKIESGIGGGGGGEQRRTDSELALHGIQGEPWHRLSDVLPAQAALLPASPSDKVIFITKEVSVLLSSTHTATTIPTSVLDPFDLTKDGTATGEVTALTSLGMRVRREPCENITIAPGPKTKTPAWRTTTVYIGPDGSTLTPEPTSIAIPSTSHDSSAGEKGGIAGGTVGAVLLVALLTVACYRRSRRRVRQKEGFLSLADSTSVSETAERGIVGHGALFGSETTTPSSSAIETTTDDPQVPGPAHIGTAKEDPTSERIPIYFQPSRTPVRRYIGLPSTPRPSIRRSDYLNPVVREPAPVVPPPLRPGRRTLARSRSVPGWLEFRDSAREPAAPQSHHHHHQATRGSRRGLAARSMTSSVYSSVLAADEATFGARTSRATTAMRASGATDGSGLRSTLAHFPRPPRHTFSSGGGRGVGTSWRESFAFSALEDEVLLAFPSLAREMEGRPF